MKKSIPIRLAGILSLAAISAATASETLDLWDDPTFQKQFLGSYGVRAEVEPRVTQVEREKMEKVLELLDEDKDSLGAAERFLERNIKPANSAIFDFTLANVYFQQDELEDAAEAYVRAVEKFPSFQRAYKNLGLIHVRRGDFDKALEPLTRVMELGATDGLTYGLLGYAYAMDEQYASAESAYRQAIMLQPATLDWKLGLARCLFKQRKFGEAAGLCDELIRRDPEKPDYWLLQANAYLGMEESMLAARNYEYLDLHGLATVGSLNTLGDIYANTGMMDMAAEAYQRAMDRAGSDEPPDRFIRDGEVLAARGAHGPASRLIEKLRVRFGDRLSESQQKRILKLQARLAAAEGEGDEKQMRILQEIVDLDPLDGEALILLARLHSRHDEMEKAAFLFERAQNLEAFEAEASLRHAQCLVKHGRYREALPLLKRSLGIEPREDVQAYMKQVEKVARLQE